MNMKDIIWTLIVVWFVMRLVELFKVSVSRKAHNPGSIRYNTQSTEPASVNNSDKLKKAVREHVNKEGEYIEYEEVK